MNMKKLLLIIFFGSYSILSAQYFKKYQKEDTIYYNDRYRFVEKEMATRFAIVKDINKENPSEKYVLDFYHLDKDSKEFFKRESLSTRSAYYISRQGKNTFYRKNGFKEEEGNRVNNKPMGIWTYWYEDGTKKSQYEFFDSKQTAMKRKKKSRLVNFWSPSGELLVENGKGTYYFEKDNGDIVKGNYLNSKKEGVWEGFRKDGTKRYSEKYVKDSLIGGESWDKQGNKYLYYEVSEKGVYSQGREAMVKIIRENFKVPKFAIENGIEGTTIISFEVNTEGSMENIQVAQYLCGPCSEEAIRVTKLLKKWKPGKTRGQLSRIKYNLPFHITLTSK